MSVAVWPFSVQVVIVNCVDINVHLKVALAFVDDHAGENDEGNFVELRSVNPGDVGVEIALTVGASRRARDLLEANEWAGALRYH